ncbi:MAG: hypothetical protein Harvfovirus2_19 [Harvfovirus sp.]|uniref:RING-type domain-containing protein n=1 Tax=Harvfovirus sp. TaxID=2487768 RepID=A0A3G5A4U1_9VIRU|nr:MAG: hypothetical protein Harvfovirus2_19 [Harvfovirus sp.]
MSYVLLQCVKEKGKLKVKMISSAPFIKGANCQFPRAIRAEGLYYVVKSEGVKLTGKFYTATQKGIIVCQTNDLNEVKKYVDSLNVADTKIQPKVIFGDDDNEECVICMGEKKECVFSPCGHFITCAGCSTEFDKCPICRAKIGCVLRRDEIKN